MIFVEYYFILYLDLKELGFAYAKLIHEILAMTVFLCLLYFRGCLETVILPKMTLIMNGLKTFLKKCSYSLVAIFGESIACELTTLLAAQLKNTEEMAVWMKFVSIGLLFYSSSMGFSNTFRTRIGQLVGERLIKAARTQAILYYLYIFVLSLIFKIAILTYASEIESAFINNEKIIPKVAECLCIMCTYLYSFLILYTFFAIFRILNMDFYFLKMISFVFPVANFIFSVVFGFGFGWKLRGIVIGVSVTTNSMVLIFFYKVFKQTNLEEQVMHEKQVCLIPDIYELKE